ncbi:MAG TPA: replicative DNA helicase, partial [Thermoleophilia bacterium]|nr:replicative DNA helicase [Thermoleophilia bacterium]
MAVRNIEQVVAHVPPHNLEAEESVLGAMVISPNAIAAVTEILSPNDFYRDSHRAIYRCILALYARGGEVDAVTLSAELEHEGILEKVGGKAFVHTLVEIVPAAANARQYAEIVRETSVLRALIQVGQEIAELGYLHPDDTANLLDRCEQKVFAISQQRRTSEFAHIRDILKRNFERIELLQKDATVSGLACGFPGIDKLTGGFQPSNLVVLAARPGMGKTSLALNVAHNVAVDGKAPVAVFSLEMSSQELGERMICSAARVSSHKVRTGALSGDDYAKLIQVVGELEKADIFIDDSAGLNMFELRAKARRLAAKKPLGLVIVDYLQLMMGDGRAENRQQEVANISRSLKQLARELEIPVIAVSQLNRSPEVRQDKRPQLSDLRECLAGDSLVTISGSGGRVPMRDLAGETRIPVWSLDSRLRLRQGIMTEAWRTGTRPVRRVVLASGREISA